MRPALVFRRCPKIESGAVQGPGSGIQGLGFRARGLGFRLWCLGCRVYEGLTRAVRIRMGVAL